MICNTGVLVSCGLMLALVLNGCDRADRSARTQDRSQSDGGGDAETGTSPATEFAFVAANYFDSKDDMEFVEIRNNPSAEDIEKRFAATRWDHPNIRPILRLTCAGDWSVTIPVTIEVTRNQSEEGGFQVIWTDLVDGEYREAESTKVDSPEKLLDLLLAFHRRDPELARMIEWDYLE